MSTSGPVLVRELTARERLCLVCNVPRGCNEEDPRCDWQKGRTLTGHRAVTARTKQRRRRKAQIVSYMERWGIVTLASLTAKFRWRSTETGLLMVDLKRARVVMQHGEGKEAVWRLANGT